MSDTPSSTKPRRRSDGPRARVADGRGRGSSAVGPPRYQQVAEALIEGIASGAYPVGALLPTEMELCTQYRISRSTVREALRRLRDAGLISRRRRVGTEVVARTPPANYRQRTNSIADLLQYADDTHVEIISKRRLVCDGALAELLECDEGHAWIRIRSLRTVPGNPRPVCLTTAHIDAGFPDLDANLDSMAGPISALLERVYGVRIARIDQSIQAIRLGREDAKLLRAGPGSPALRAVRRYYTAGGRLIELASAIHPGDRFTYVTSLVRD